MMGEWGFWLAVGVMALMVCATLMRAMLRAKAEVDSSAAFDLAVYRDQLREIDRDIARGTVNAEEGARLRTEVSRRLLEADRAGAAVAAAPRPAAGRGLSALVALAVVGSVALYWQIGAPGYPDLPLKLRLEQSEALRVNRPSQAEAEAGAQLPPPRADVDASFQDLMEKLRAAVKDRPDDLRGLELLARNEAALGNIGAAITAQRGLISAKAAAATAADHAALAELMIVATGGYVSPEAEAVLVEALQKDQRNATARYYSGVMFAQVGRFDRTFILWRALLDEGPPDAPWIAPIRSQMEDIAARAGVNYTLPDLAQPGPSEADVAAAAEMTPEERQAMIEGMVGQLGERLATEGGKVEDWIRLITSLGVLGRTDEAKEIYAEAQTRFAGQSVELSVLAEAAAQAGIGP